MKIAVVSDITLSNVYGSSFEGHEILHIYSEDLLSALLTLDPDSYDVVYIHADNWFKYFEDHYIKQLHSQINKLAAATKWVLLSNLVLLQRSSGLLKDEISASLNPEALKLLELRSFNNLFFLDHQKGLLIHGLGESYNYKLGFSYQMPYKKKFIDHLKLSLSKILQALTSEEKKAIVVDCDNTLWKGIVGEDGVDGIYCDKTADGIIYHHFQNFLKRKKSEGFVLCIASKNNFEDVEEAFNKKSMPLSWDDFILKEINWENKLSNISAIATKLNVGLSSLIFVDDSEFELNSVKEARPEIACLKVENSMESLEAIFDHPAFLRKSITTEDRNKTELYQAEQLRESERQNYSIEEYISSLGIKTEVRINEPWTYERLSQLTEKTNQFNFNKIPYSVMELEKMADNGGRIFSISASDKYGDYGIIGMAVVLPVNESEMKVHNILMSCRALGRGIEQTFLHEIRNDIFQQGKILKEIEFLKTSKNKPAEEFYRMLSL